MLRQRMDHCRFLLFATSKASPDSKWMPWELGYFDGLRREHGWHPAHRPVGRRQLQRARSTWAYTRPGELIDFDIGRHVLRRLAAPNQGETLKQAAQRAYITS